MSADNIKPKGKLNIKYIFAIICIVLAIAFVSLFTPIYSISEILVEGNAAVSPETIIKASAIEYGDSFFEVNITEAEKKVSTVSYVDTVKIRRVFPDKIRITVTESTEVVYVCFAGNYIGIDSKGKILQVTQDAAAILKPLVNGVNINSFTIGSYIDIANEDKKHLLFELASAIEEEGIPQDIYSIDITDTENIFMITRNNITVKMGDNENIRYKTAYLKTVLPELAGETGGVLDLADTKNVIYTN